MDGSTKQARRAPAGPGAGTRTGTRDCEVLIAGGGLVGLTLGIALADAGLDVIVIDRDAPAAVQAATFDGRASAIARGSQQALAAIGLWDAMAASAQPIEDIRVSDGRVGHPVSRLFLHYDCEEVDGAPLGYMLENRSIRAALHAKAPHTAGLRLLAPAQVVDMSRDAHACTVTLDDGRTLSAQLMVAADGKRSRLRAAAGIPVTAWDYPQAGIVCTVAHAEPHHGTAHENFLPSGPFAMLPLRDGDDGTGRSVHRSSIVWTEKRDLAAAMMAQDDATLSAEIQRRFGDSLGALGVIRPRWSYLLSLSLAKDTVAERFALVGDAARGIHPISGQGLNLGIKDVAALAEVLIDARRLGLDPGQVSVLRRYARWRRFDNLTLIAVTDGLNRLFSNDAAPLRLARDLGLAAVDRMPPLKRFFMRHAMGLVGDLPRLIRGEAL